MADAKKPAVARSKAAAARAEKTTGRTVTKHGLTLKLPAKLPFNVARWLREDDVVGALEAIIGPEQLEKVWAANLDVDQGGELLDAILGQYGVSEGE